MYAVVTRGIGAAGSAPPWHGGGHRFEPDMLHQSTYAYIKRLHGAFLLS
jgi:hypothetical protein